MSRAAAFLLTADGERDELVDQRVYQLHRATADKEPER
jgi:hypothetical protein